MFIGRVIHPLLVITSYSIHYTKLYEVRIDTDEGDEARHYLKRLLKEYASETGSSKAQEILENFRVEIRNFWLVRPKDMKKLPLNQEKGD